MDSEAVSVTLRVTGVLERLDVRYVVGGSMASTAYGRIRTTLDVDILADLTSEHVDPLLRNVAEDFYVDASMIHQAIENHSSFNLIHFATGFKVDIFVMRERPFDRQQLTRRQARPLGEAAQVAYFASPEDVILAKLDWYKLGGEVSERQWRDVQGVLDVQGEQIDRDYLQQWAKRLDVADLLGKALQEHEGK